MSYITDDNVSNNNVSDSKYLAIFEHHHGNMLVDQTIEISDFGEGASNIEIIEESEEEINEINTRATREKSIMNEIDDNMGEASKSDKKEKKKAISHKAGNKSNLSELPEFELLHTFSNHHGYSTLPHEMQIGIISPIGYEGGRVWVPLTLKELKVWIALVIYMSVHKIYAVEDLWNSNEKMAVHNIKQFMSLYRFQQIKKFLHIFNPTEPKSYWYSKIEPLASNLRETFKKLYTPSTRVSIDEMIVRFSDCSMHTFKIKNKPTPEGYKIFSLCDAGYTWTFVFYSRVEKNSELEHINGINDTGCLVWHLAKQLSCGKNFQIYMDNYFTSIPLFNFLRTNNLGACDTVRTNSSKFPKILKLENPLVLDWDTLSVMVFGDNVRKELKIPKLIDDYNHYMGGLLDTTLVNCFLLYCKISDMDISSKDFRIALAWDLIQENLKIMTKKITRKRPNNVFSAESSKNKRVAYVTDNFELPLFCFLSGNYLAEWRNKRES
ncbi:13916_t:CDS:2, partial [Cetraspora pellucida]